MATYFVDKAVGADVNAGTSEGAGNAWETIDKAMNTVAAGDKVWIKASADYVTTSTIDTAGTATAPIVYEGYTTTTGDGGKCTIDGTDNTLASGITSGIGGALFHLFKNILVRDMTGIGFDMGAGDAVMFKNCEATLCDDYGFSGDNNIMYEECSSHGNTSAGGFNCDLDGCYVGCRAYDNTGVGIEFHTGIALFCVAYGNSAQQFRCASSGYGWFINCTADGENAGSTAGFAWANANILQQMAVNCICYDLATGFISGRNQLEFTISRNNLVNSNTANYSSYATHSGEVTSAPGFTDEASADYTLTSGSAAKAAGFDGGKMQA